MLSISTAIGFLGSLSILGLLAVAYGGLYRVLPSKRWFAPLMGTLFGIVAFVQMHSPLEPYPGMIVDMRNVPIVLAGAFLGGRGLLPALVIAVLARVEIGGVGMMSGVAALVAAGAIGLLWQEFTPSRGRTWLSIGLLGVLTSGHLIGVVLLPPALASWFLQEAAPLLIIINVIAVPIVAGLLEREQRQLRREERLAQDARFTIGQDLMSVAALDWALSQASETGSLSKGASVIALRIRFKGALAQLWGKDADRIAMQVFHQRLAAVMPKGGLVGWAAEDLVLMAIPRVGPEAARGLMTRIRRDVSSTPISLPGMTPFRLVLDLDVRNYDILPGIEGLAFDLIPAGMPEITAMLTPPKPLQAAAKKYLQRSSQTLAKDLVGSESDLFSTFDRLRDARYGPA